MHLRLHPRQQCYGFGVNFLGHAFIALARSDQPAFVLGSMLPDFAGMTRHRLTAQSHAGVEGGVQLHHATDSAFHAHPHFTRLTESVTSRLREWGLARGTARAVGHIGVELLLDGEIVQNPGLQAAYIDALNASHALPLGLHADLGERDVRVLCRRLSDYGVPWDYQTPDGVAYRIARALAGRPRLALRPEDTGPVQRALSDVQPHVQAIHQALLDDVAEGLSALPSPR